MRMICSSSKCKRCHAILPSAAFGKLRFRSTIDLDFRLRRVPTQGAARGLSKRVKVRCDDVPQVDPADRLTIACSYLVPQLAVRHQEYQSIGESLNIVRGKELQ